MTRSILSFSLFGVLAACGSKPPAPAAPPELKSPPQQPAPVPVAAAAPVPQPPSAEQELTSTCRSELAAAKGALDQIVAVGDARTIDNTLEPFNEIARHVANAAYRGGLWKEVHPDPKVREAARACNEEAQKFNSALLVDRRVYDALVAVDVKSADAETQRTMMLVLRDYKLAGVDRDDATRKRLVELDEQITKLGIEFDKNIAEDTRSVDVDPKRLDGLPADWIAAHKVHDGVVTITTDYPDFVPVMAHATDDDLRKQLYIKSMSRGDAHNEDVLKQLLALRAAKAKLLGYKDWADYISADKMLRGGKAEADFIARVSKLANARMKKDYAELLAQKRKTAPKASSVDSWQKWFLETQIKKEKYAVDAAEVRTLFVYDSVLKGLLDITSELYDVQYRSVANDPQAWHPDVAVFDVMRGEEKLGRIYLDMHPRPDKFKHFAEFPIRDGIAGKQLPEGALVCNLPDPKTSAGPALMEHGDAVTMFHEFGHLMHHILAGKHHWARIAGISTEQDFVEAPSQMFEEWAWRYDTLKRFAKTPDGKPISEDLVAKMNRAHTFGMGTQTAQQMLYAAVSLEYHRADPAKLDPLAEWKTLQAKYTPFAYVDGTRQYTAFGHLNGYSSMYYTYMWSLVIARDMLTAFAKPGLMSTDVAHRYRDMVLAQGAFKDAADLVKDFLGRPYDFKAFEKYLSE
jgi:thimet oligopeptidase